MPRQGEQGSGGAEPGIRRRIYLDHAATTPVREEVAAAMEPFLSDRFGNPSSLHAEGREAREALEEARESIRQACGAGEFGLVFTSGGSEADSLALVGGLLALKRKSRPAFHVVTSAVEHPAVLNSLSLVEDLGGRATVVPVDGEGLVDLEALAKSLGDETALVSLMAANNETGALQPLAAAGRLARDRGAIVHTDAVQALGKVPLGLDALPVDMATVSSHKLHGPKGIAGLLVRQGTAIEPLLRGGSQEAGLRAGTENVAAAVGFARAVELAVEERESVMARLGALRDEILAGIVRRFPDARVNTPAAALPTILNVSFPWVEGESLVRLLDWLGVAASTGSACNVGSKKPSHVLRAMGRSEREVRGSLRLSLGRGNTAADVGPFLEALGEAVGRLEKIAPAGV